MEKDPNFQYYVGPECQGLYGDALSSVNRERVEVALVAEKGARDEVRNNRPLIGYTGNMARRHLELAGIAPSAVWLTNSVHNFQDPDANPTRSDIQREQPRLLKELAELPNLRVIIAMGEAAMESLSGFHRQGITKWRGSILPSIMDGTKMIPTFHPSYYSRDGWKLGYWRPVVQFDINRAIRERHTHDLNLPAITHHVEPTWEEANEWLDYLESDNDSATCRERPLLVFDLEMVKCLLGTGDRRFVQWFMSCIGFAKRPDEGFCIPIMRRDRIRYWTRSQEASLRLRFQDLLLQRSKCFSTQGGVTADCWWLRREGIITPYMDRGLDTMYAHRLLAPDLPHALQFLTSIYTRMPFYKDESGKNEKVPVSDRQFWNYNCKDVTGQAAVAIALEEELKETGQWQFFCDEVQSLWPVISDMIERGFRVDRIAQQVVGTRLAKEIEELSHDLDGMVGWSPNVKSPLDMEKLLEQYKIQVPPSKKTKLGHPKAGEDDILGYANAKGNEGFKPIASKLLEVRTRRTLVSNFLHMTTDKWGYYHPTYDIIHARTLRLSSSGDDQGPQLQNVPHSMRHIWIPDPGHVLSICDYKQAETYLTAWDAEDYFLMEAFSKGKDVHQVRGCMIFHRWNSAKGLPPDDMLATITDVCDPCHDRGEKKCIHSKRFISKVAGHAFDGMQGPRTFITHELLPIGIFMSEAEAKKIRAVVVSKAIERWQARAETELKQSPWATNAYGLKREFYGGVITDDIVRAFVDWKKQSVVACLTNRAMRLFHTRCEEEGYLERARVVNQMHDSLTISHDPALTDWVSQTMEEVCYYRLVIHGRPLVIPIDKEMGLKNWGGKK